MSAVSSPGVERGAAAGPTCSDPSTSWPLPVELFLQCLLVADLVTRIRASHACRTWSNAALAERSLWDSLACFRSHSKQHEDIMFSLLEAMLLRSRPLPFHLTVPHLYGRPGYDYTALLLGLKELDVFRLAAYHGPTRVFRLLNRTCAPLPILLYLDAMRFPDDGDPDITTIYLVGQFGAHYGAPFSALHDITLEGVYGRHHRVLFRHCSSLVWVDITHSAPPSLEEVWIACRPSNELDPFGLMENWRGLRVRRLAARWVYSLKGILLLSLASHKRKIELRLTGNEEEVVLATIPNDDSF